MAKSATLEITGDLLRHVLAIPEGVEVELVYHREDDVFRLLLRGDALPVGCEVDVSGGSLPPQLKPVYHSTGGIVDHVEWQVTNG